MKSKDYQEFTEKFKPKLTTDDCITLDAVYDAVLGWVCKEYGVTPEQVVRPFWPGMDYQKAEYPEGCVVVDNPPFSILAGQRNQVFSVCAQPDGVERTQKRDASESPDLQWRRHLRKRRKGENRICDQFRRRGNGAADRSGTGQDRECSQCSGAGGAKQEEKPAQVYLPG